MKQIWDAFKETPNVIMNEFGGESSEVFKYWRF